MKSRNALSHWKMFIIIILLVCIPGCEEEEDKLDNSDLLQGSWYLDNSETYFEITSSISQNAASIYGECDGSIELSGYYNESLNYMIQSEENTIVFNSAAITSGSTSESNGYLLMLSGEDSSQTAMLMVSYPNDSSNAWYSDEVEFEYNSVLSALRVENTPLHPFLNMNGLDSADIIQISGIMSNRLVHLEPGVPTQVPMDLLGVNEMDETILIESDQITIVDDYGNFNDTLVFSWELSGDQMVWTNTHGETNPENWNSIHLNYTVTEDELTLIIEEDCATSYNEAECLSELEIMLALEAESLTSGKQVISLRYLDHPVASTLRQSGLRPSDIQQKIAGRIQALSR